MMLMLRNPNDSEPEDWIKFWTSFETWFNSDAVELNFFYDKYLAQKNGEIVLNIDLDDEYKKEYGVGYPFFSNHIDVERIERFLKIAYKKWIMQDKIADFNKKINDDLKKFNLQYDFFEGELCKQNEKKLTNNGKTYNVNNIKLKKGQSLNTAFETYTIKKQLSQGGNGKVYQAVQGEGENVAIKVVYRLTGSKANRFKNEIGFCEKYSNKNIIRIIDHGAIDAELVFYVMPMAKETLRERIKNGILPNDAEEIFINIMQGLEYAHSKKAYHRDIKPENILFLDDSNTAIIADFGIAHFCEDDMIADIKTKSTDRLANFQYAAPEQRKKGAADKVDGRADLYAAGLILNEMFTGEIVAGSNFKKISDVFSEYAYLDDIFDKLYCQNPEERLFPADKVISEIQELKNSFREGGKNNE